MTYQISNKPNVTIFTDGAARGNPDGPGGYGAVIVFIGSDGTRHEKELSCGYKKTTNNRMELMAAIAALEALTKPCNVTLYSDSQYLVKAFEERWVNTWLKENWRIGKKNEVKNIDLWKRLLTAMEGHSVRYVWVRGHSGHPENERCDKLATQAADGGDLKSDM